MHTEGFAWLRRTDDRVTLTPTAKFCFSVLFDDSRKMFQEGDVLRARAPSRVAPSQDVSNFTYLKSIHSIHCDCAVSVVSYAGAEVLVRWRLCAPPESATASLSPIDA